MSQDSGSGQPNCCTTFDPRPLDKPRVTSFVYKKGWSSVVHVLRCLETKEMQQVGVRCSGSRFPSSVQRVSPMTGASFAFVDKGSSMKRTALRSLIQSMQQNNVVEVVRDTATSGFYCHLFLVPKKSKPVIDLSFLNFFQVTPTLDQYQIIKALIRSFLLIQG